MWIVTVGKHVAHTSSLRLSLVLLILVTLLYLVVYILWESSSFQDHSRLSAVNLHRLRTSVKTGLIDSYLDGHQHNDVSEMQENVVSEGQGVWVKGRHIEVMSAIHDLHHLNKTETRIVLPSFLQHSADRDFVCCFHTSAAGARDYVQVSASLDYIDLRFIVDMQNAAFHCTLDNARIRAGISFKFVSFGPRVCSEGVSLPLKIVYPQRRSWEFAVCTKVAYARLEPSRLVEWFEYMREIGASKVVTFYNNLHPDSKHVFDYYAQTSFLELIEYRPRNKINSSRILFTEKNSQTRQARHDKTLVVRDCQYRLAGYDFVTTIDFDELPVPLRPFGSLNWILQNMLRDHPDAAAFRMDPILLPPEWQNPVPDLYHWQFSTGAYIAPYCIKWVYIPSRTWVAATHEIIPKTGYLTYVIPQEILHFLHFRSCKAYWREVPCQNLTQTVRNELSLKRFTGEMLRKLRKLPLENLIPDKNYVKFIRTDARDMSDTKH